MRPFTRRIIVRTDGAPLLHLLGSPHDALDHVPEYEGVEGQHRVPVESAQHAARHVIGRLGQGPVVDPELEPGLAEDLHLGLEQEPLVIDQIHDPPDVKHVADAQIRLDPPPHRCAETAHELVHQPSDLPEDVEGEPPPLAPDGLHGAEYPAGGQVSEINGLDIAKHCTFHIILTERIGHIDEAVRPSAGHPLMYVIPHCFLDDLSERGDGSVVEVRCRRSLSACCSLRACRIKGLHDCRGKPVRQRCQQHEVQRRKAGEREGDVDNYPLHPHHIGGHAQHVLQTHRLGANVDYDVAPGTEQPGAGQELDRVLDADRPGPSPHPSRRKDHRRISDEVPLHLEEEASRADDSAGLQPDSLDLPGSGAQDFPCAGHAPQQAARRVPDSLHAKIHDLPDPALDARLPEPFGEGHAQISEPSVRA